MFALSSWKKLDKLFFFTQVTSYGHKDENNKFLVKKWNIEPPAIYSEEWDKADVELVKHGDLIR